MTVCFLYCISFLGCVDKIGIAFEAPTISTGFGAYLAQVRVNRLCYVLWLCFEMVQVQIHKFCWLAVTCFISKGVWLGCVYVYWCFITQLVHKRLFNNHAEHTQKCQNVVSVGVVTLLLEWSSVAIKLVIMILGECNTVPSSIVLRTITFNQVYQHYLWLNIVTC